MEKRYILSVVFVFLVVAILLSVFLSKILSFSIMSFSFGGSKGTVMFMALFVIGGVLLGLTHSMWK